MRRPWATTAQQPRRHGAFGGSAGTAGAAGADAAGCPRGASRRPTRRDTARHLSRQSGTGPCPGDRLPERRPAIESTGDYPVRHSRKPPVRHSRKSPIRHAQPALGKAAAAPIRTVAKDTPEKAATTAGTPSARPTPAPATPAGTTLLAGADRGVRYDDGPVARSFCRKRRRVRKGSRCAHSVAGLLADVPGCRRGREPRAGDGRIPVLCHGCEPAGFDDVAESASRASCVRSLRPRAVTS